jgi:hypothetical protein
MALQSEINLEGLVKKDGYWKVSSINWDANTGDFIRIIISAYASKEAFLEGRREVDKEVITVPLNNPEMKSLFNTCRTSAYANAKQMNKFSNAKDV